MGAVNEAKYIFWHTIVELAEASGMPKAEWCRKNCISMKTFHHYEGIFKRQEVRKASYNNNENVSEPENETLLSDEEDHKRDIEASDEQTVDIMMESVAGDELIQESDEMTSEQTKVEDTQTEIEKSRYFEIPMTDQEESLSIEKEQTSVIRQDRKEKICTKSKWTVSSDKEDEETKTQVSDALTQTGQCENESHNNGKERSDTITIEADGYKIVIGSNVGEEALRNILKAVQNHA